MIFLQCHPLILVGSGYLLLMTTANKYDGIEFYARLARKGSKTTTGTVLLVTRAKRNGQCFAAITVPRDGSKALPIVTWVSPENLADRCTRITEADARRIAPDMMRAVDAFDRSPEYRAMYQAEIVKPGRTCLQPALEKDMPPTFDIAKKFYELYGQ